MVVAKVTNYSLRARCLRLAPLLRFFSSRPKRDALGLHMSDMSRPIDNSFDIDLEALNKKYAEERAKRLRPDAIHQYRELKGTGFDRDPHADPNFTRDPIIERTEVLITAARGWGQGHPHRREGRRLWGHLVLEPVSRRGL